MNRPFDLLVEVSGGKILYNICIYILRYLSSVLCLKIFFITLFTGFYLLDIKNLINFKQLIVCKKKRLLTLVVSYLMFCFSVLFF